MFGIYTRTFGGKRTNEVNFMHNLRKSCTIWLNLRNLSINYAQIECCTCDNGCMCAMCIQKNALKLEAERLEAEKSEKQRLADIESKESQERYAIFQRELEEQQAQRKEVERGYCSIK